MNLTMKSFGQGGAEFILTLQVRFSIENAVFEIQLDKFFLESFTS